MPRRINTLAMDSDQYDRWHDAELARIDQTKFSEDAHDQALCQELARLSLEDNPDIVNELLHDNRKKTDKEVNHQMWRELQNGVKHDDKIVASFARMLIAAVRRKPIRSNLIEAAHLFGLYAYASESFKVKVDAIRLLARDVIHARLKSERAKRDKSNVVPLSNAYSPERAFQNAQERLLAYRNYAGEAEQFLSDVTRRIEQLVVDCDM